VLTTVAVVVVIAVIAGGEVITTTARKHAITQRSHKVRVVPFSSAGGSRRRVEQQMASTTSDINCTPHRRSCMRVYCSVRTSAKPSTIIAIAQPGNEAGDESASITTATVEIVVCCCCCAHRLNHVFNVARCTDVNVVVAIDGLQEHQTSTKSTKSVQQRYTVRMPLTDCERAHCKSATTHKPRCETRCRARTHVRLRISNRRSMEV
jgi:hypothetical protein